MISKLVRWVCTLHKYHAGNNSTISKSRRCICLLFSVYSRKLRLFNNYLSWFISHLFQKENGSWKFRVCSSFFIKVTLECNSFGVCHHWHLIHADLLRVLSTVAPARLNPHPWAEVPGRDLQLLHFWKWAGRSLSVKHLLWVILQQLWWSNSIRSTSEFNCTKGPLRSMINDLN